MEHLQPVRRLRLQRSYNDDTKGMGTQRPDRERFHGEAGFGLHPQVVAERAHGFLLLEYLPAARYVGEIGLDASPQFYPSFAEQERATEILSACARSGPSVLSVHSAKRSARSLTLSIAEPETSREVCIGSRLSGGSPTGR